MLLNLSQLATAVPSHLSHTRYPASVPANLSIFQITQLPVYSIRLPLIAPDAPTAQRFAVLPQHS